MIPMRHQLTIGLLASALFEIATLYMVIMYHDFLSPAALGTLFIFSLFNIIGIEVMTRQCTQILDENKVFLSIFRKNKVYGRKYLKCRIQALRPIQLQVGHFMLISDSISLEIQHIVVDNLTTLLFF